jgi:hypothetical protein
MRIISSRLVQLAACAAFVAFSAPLGAAPATLKGEVVDQACYTKDHANVGEKHKDCGLSCAKKGGKLALVTSDGQVYTIVGAYTENKNAKLLEANLFGVPVEATGEVTDKDGGKQIDVSALKKVS